MEFLKRLKYISRLVVTTPHYIWIILFNLVSAVFTFVGIPLLLPALEYLRTDVVDERNLGYIEYVENLFGFVGLETNFYSIVIVAAVFIFSGQLILLMIELFNKRVQISLINNYMHEFISRYYRASWTWISDDQSGRFHSAVSREAGGASEAHLDSQRVFTSLIYVIVYTAIALLLSASITLWAAMFFGCILLINIKYADKINEMSKLFNQVSISLSSFISSLTRNKKFFKATSNGSYYIDVVLDKVKEVNKKNWDLTLIGGILNTFTTMTSVFFIILIFLLHSYLNINLSELIILLLVFKQLAPQFTSLSGNYARISEKIPIHQSANNRIEELKANLEITGSKNFKALNPIRFEDVSYGYKKGKLVIKNADVEISPLCSTAIVGGSGAGKSTLLDLFLGLLKPDSGVIYYGDIHHKDMDITTLRNKVAYVSQETTLLDGSLLYNLTITNPEASEAEVKDACSKAQINEMINELPDGLDTEIGENGIKLSGGQCQRVVLGRALITNPEILILDEATSQLDSETELFIQQAIKKLHKKLSIIIVAHRLSTVKFADTVYVLEKGRIAEHGSYAELLEQKGRLYELDVLQH